VLSTLHTNSAVGAITRLRDMGVEPFLLSSSVIGVLAQRLVRRLCGACKNPYPASAADREALGRPPTDEPPVLYAPRGCEHCNQSGYRGRAGIFELVPLGAELQARIHEGSGEQELERLARGHTPSIRDDGRERVLRGETSLEELVRVTQES
jgi:general secretion pathway protein E